MTERKCLRRSVESAVQPHRAQPTDLAGRQIRVEVRGAIFFVRVRNRRLNDAQLQRLDEEFKELVEQTGCREYQKQPVLTGSFGLNYYGS
jgi:hypothetical protein